jgi:hypothetical protein
LRRRFPAPGWRVCYYHGQGGGPPFANVNALRHGGRSAWAMERRREVAALIRVARAAMLDQ